ncbi:DUF1707 SHOCT-like domain-containing protein [Jiangella rhizosphaerae]|uniref:DUF1707 and DUF2154 domain-containing protein n=1 Tax=Jiangella rhizosphaerae TaxID=2293569 RepID=A0A418KMG4_9ACTN|nr:DUF1707 domain-containing protein [Jiangella rhizosphaerae]RIQ20166.1 DUF1707 and DUF2154 domain-containing protein [Jiangella rhizosphaerae]
MTIPSEPADQPREPRVLPGVRASDAEREQVVQALSEHATTGRLTLAELEERIGLAYRSVTRDDLAKLTADLPGSSALTPAAPDARVARPEAVARRSATRWIVAFMGGTEKRGRWRAAERINAVAVMGGHDIDLRHAELDSDETTIVAITVMGGMDIYVPDTIDVEVGGFSLMGGTGERGSRRPARAGAPRIRILAYNLMGGIDVWRLPEETKNMTLKQAKKAAKRAE